MILRNALFALIFFLVALAPSNGGAKQNPREQLDTAIQEAIRLLEAKDYAQFLKMFVTPDEFKQITQEVSLKLFSEEFGNKKAANLLITLKQIQSQTPTFDSTGDNATYQLKEPVGKKNSITLTKIKKYWYIQN